MALHRGVKKLLHRFVVGRGTLLQHRCQGFSGQQNVHANVLVCEILCRGPC